MTSNASDILACIQQSLSDVETSHDIKILYACESGSRAWGFASPDSDYDVRFIYVRPRDWYLAIDVERKPDTINVPIDDVLDIGGWDLRKTLQLFQRSNPPLHEWLRSPIVYRQHGDLAQRLRDLSASSYNPIAAHYHYLSMAFKTHRDHLAGQQVRWKKYLYALRSLLAVIWLEKELGVVPVEFDKLVAKVVDDRSLLGEIKQLLVVKKRTGESAAGSRFNLIHDFIEQQLKRIGEPIKRSPGQRIGIADLNKLFCEFVNCEFVTD